MLAFYLIKPCWERHSNKSTNSKNTDIESKKSNKKEQKKKLKKFDLNQTDSEMEEEILIPWTAGNNFNDPKQKAIRFTPLKRRIIENRVNILKSETEVMRFTPIKRRNVEKRDNILKIENEGVIKKIF